MSFPVAARLARASCALFGALATACSSDPEVRGETAEVYFARFESALLEANVIHLEHSLIASDEVGGAQAVWEGRFRAIDQPLEVVLDGRGTFGSKPVHIEIAARGTTVTAVGGPQPVRQESPGLSMARWVHGFARLGFAQDLWRIARGMPLLFLDAEAMQNQIEVSGLRFEGRERLAGAPTRVLSYHASVGDLLSADVRLWIDERTGHPLQRRAHMQTSTLRLKTTETYRVLELATIPKGGGADGAAAGPSAK